MDARVMKRPMGVILLGVLVLAGAVVLNGRSLPLHTPGVTPWLRLIAALILIAVAAGLWRLKNGARIFLFFLLFLDVLTSLTALFLYVLRQPNSTFGLWLLGQFCILALVTWLLWNQLERGRLALAIILILDAVVTTVFLSRRVLPHPFHAIALVWIIEVCAALGLMWYLQTVQVKHAFRGLSAWPKTVQMFILTVFTVLLAFPFAWMAIASFKQNIDLYAMENNPFVFNMAPTLDHLRFLFSGSDFHLVVVIVEFCVATFLIWAVWKLAPKRLLIVGLLVLAALESFFVWRHAAYWPIFFAALHICVLISLVSYLWDPRSSVRALLIAFLGADLLAATVTGFDYALSQTGFVRWLGNTSLVGLIVVVITLLLALPAAYALARLTGRWGERLGIGIFLTYLVPPTLLFIPLSRVVAWLGLQDTIWALVVVYPSVTVPFSVWLLMGFFKSIPRELEDAAMVDGLTRFGAFVRMVVPISLSGILTVVIFTFTLVTQEFVYALTFISPDSQQMVGVGVPIFLVRGDVYYWGALMAACLIASIPIAFLYNLFLDRFIAGFTVGAVKG